MKHVTLVSRDLPKQALSIVEWDGVFKKISNMVSSIGDLLDFWRDLNEEA